MNTKSKFDLIMEQHGIEAGDTVELFDGSIDRPVLGVIKYNSNPKVVDITDEFGDRRQYDANSLKEIDAYGNSDFPGNLASIAINGIPLSLSDIPYQFPYGIDPGEKAVFYVAKSKGGKTRQLMLISKDDIYQKAFFKDCNTGEIYDVSCVTGKDTEGRVYLKAFQQNPCE